MKCIEYFALHLLASDYLRRDNFLRFLYRHYFFYIENYLIFHPLSILRPNCVLVKKKRDRIERAFIRIFFDTFKRLQISLIEIYIIISYPISVYNKKNRRGKEGRNIGGRMVTRRKLFPPRNSVQHLECIVRNVWSRNSRPSSRNRSWGFIIAGNEERHRASSPTLSDENFSTLPVLNIPLDKVSITLIENDLFILLDILDSLKIEASTTLSILAVVGRQIVGVDWRRPDAGEVKIKT